ncbi:polysaccharide pyruvyl transferase CsaB [Brevibacillus centrosporus]|jgi:polysaccharide pyruvyl transferase CsaB|uniref:polysaccharide pyruvyl transferase CsaB n=1 Tax=Brevibacillus centrosporus TaxID=54910 RepID=UPI002E1F5072|nr:polysaccharide pyruvyl transferase CsaB [Brevibacillus centrosporus]MED1952716.1 polysaccharide pyruvyl transferase CsaB [Brevibacillus centrosporus]
MSRILISGYYGFNNAGDDVVLYGIISSLKREQPNISLAVLSNQPDRTAELFGIEAYDRWSFGTIVRELMRSDMLVMGGGTLMQDVTSPRSVLYYLGIVTIAKLLGKPVVFYAQGFGPILKPLSRSMIKRVVNRVDVITVRDYESGEDFKSCGVVKAPIHITADPALTISPEDISDERGLELLQGKFADPAKPLVAISVRNWKQEQAFKKVIARAADWFLLRGWNVLFLPMHVPSDLAPSREIMDQMQQPGARLLDEPVTFHDIMSVLKQCDYVVGMRLHSLILACMLRTPFIGISYDPKIDRFVERAGMPNAGHITKLAENSLLALLAERLDRMDQEIGVVTEHSRLLEIEAAKSSELVLQALQKKH